MGDVLLRGYAAVQSTRGDSRVWEVLPENYASAVSLLDSSRHGTYFRGSKLEWSRVRPEPEVQPCNCLIQLQTVERLVEYSAATSATASVGLAPASSLS
jgi:hypothetical protein